MSFGLEQVMTKQCQTCIHWAAKNRAASYSAPCTLGYGQMRFDEMCSQHQEVQAHNEARPGMYEMWKAMRDKQ